LWRKTLDRIARIVRKGRIARDSKAHTRARIQAFQVAPLTSLPPSTSLIPLAPLTSLTPLISFPIRLLGQSSSRSEAE
jgi:hypothetical protein